LLLERRDGVEIERVAAAEGTLDVGGQRSGAVRGRRLPGALPEDWREIFLRLGRG
jgi:hypothetical protein